MRPIYLTRTLTAASANAIALAQQLVAAGDLILNGASVSGGVATLDAQRKVGIASTANFSATTFTVYGTDEQGHVISESLAGPNNNTVSTILDYKTVTRISASTALGTNVTAGTTAVGASQPVPMDQYITDFSVTMAAIVKSGAVNYTVQYTMDDVFAKYALANDRYPGSPAGDPTTITWWPYTPDMENQAVNSKGTLIDPVKAVRIVTNSGTGSVEFQVIQGGAA